MGNFINFNELLKSLEVDASTASEPVKRMFICDGPHLTANISMGIEGGGTLHTQPAHDEINADCRRWAFGPSRRGR
ncbi:MAG: hypothetical protein OEP48_06720 [Betaproteobacteria bacterium]|nr:hypothetical protein [Betaproteobacteria bacterium]MDH3436156.1 hypothetical protein [Betaproteobacteria bacterium]